MFFQSTPTRYGEAGIIRIAMNGGLEKYSGPLPPNFQYTTWYDVEGTNSWYCLLKCQICGCMAVTRAGTGNGPAKWAQGKGWSTPPNGARKWERCQCPLHPFR